jgi:hypothetical protein
MYAGTTQHLKAYLGFYEALKDVQATVATKGVGAMKHPPTRKQSY